MAYSMAIKVYRLNEQSDGQLRLVSTSSSSDGPLPGRRMNERELVAAINRDIASYDPGLAAEFRAAKARAALAEISYTEQELNEPIAYDPAQELKRARKREEQERKRNGV